MPVALVNRFPIDRLEWAAGLDEGGVGHYFERTSELFTVGVPDRGTGIVLYSECTGDGLSQALCLFFCPDTLSHERIPTCSR